MMTGHYTSGQSPTSGSRPTRLVRGLLYFIWFGVVMSVAIHRSLHSMPIILLAALAVGLTVLCIAANWFLRSKYAAGLYYAGALPLHRFLRRSAAARRNRFTRWWGQRRDPWLDLIERSQRWNRKNPRLREGIQNGKIFAPERAATAPPLVVRREHLDSGLWRRERSFAIALLFNTIRLTYNDRKWTLHVDLRDQSCAIYSNRGKEFLRAAFLPKKRDRCLEYLKCSRETHQFLLGQAKKQALTAHIPALRWVSGGILPVANWNDQRWVCLFFRDIEPVGWNLANGASETKEEYKDLDLLIFRETLEELVICGGTPQPLAEVTRRIPWVPSPQSRKSVLEAPELVSECAALRLLHDGICFKCETGPDLLLKRTPESVTVTYHDRRRRALTATTENVLISINPLELGAEVVRVGEFALGQSDRLLDGEVCRSREGDYLVRAPIGLLSVDFLKRAYQKAGNVLGLPARALESDDRRRLDTVEHRAFHIFADDIDLRNKRLDSLQDQDRLDTPEAIRLRRWNTVLRRKFLDAQAPDGVLRDELCFLLPVVWKTLEQAFKHHVL